MFYENLQECKPVMLTSSLDKRVLHQLESSMHIEMRNFEASIKYMGFILKENTYSYEDWAWLVKKNTKSYCFLVPLVVIEGGLVGPD
jgi:hypothetical protein